MKKGIIIALITLSSIIGLNRVNATTTPGWASTLPSPQNIAYYSCTSETNCTYEDNIIDYFESNQTLRPFVTNTSEWTIGQNGYVIGSPVTTMKKGYLYSADFYICVNKAYEANFDIYTSQYQEFTNGNIYSLPRSTLISNIPVIDGGRTFTYCQIYSTLLVPEEDHNWIYFRLKRKTTNVTNFYISTVAVDTREIGIYSETIKNLIEDSGYATAESVEQVQSSVNRVEDAITGEQDYNKDASEELNGKQEIDDYTEKEEELFGRLNFEGIGNNEITINPNASTLIWSIIDRIRGMNAKIILLMTSILGLGIIKMILNR